MGALGPIEIVLIGCTLVGLGAGVGAVVLAFRSGRPPKPPEAGDLPRS